MPLCPDDCLGPYRIIGFLGAGGMGEVYRAHDPRLGRDVALKILKDRKPGFDKEARAAAALCHPNIVTIYDVGPDYVVMELIEGESLRQRLSHGALSFREVVETGAQIAEGLAAAHAARIIHRDLKPENIVIARDGHAKILDFGLAKRTDMLDSDTRETLTQPGGIKGTTAYMSPEQVRAQELDWRSDIFSLGLVLYEMVAGRRAFAGASAAETMAAIIKDAPTDFGSGVSPQLQAVILRCLEKNPERRFQSARDLAFSLRSLASAQTSEAVPRTVPQAGIESLAVMPFENMGGNPDTEYLSDGITESLINSLSRLPGLRVVARSRVFRYKGKEIDAVQVGRELNVRAMLTGRVAQHGDRLRVQVELVEAATETQIWGERFSRAAADIFEVEEEIARQISEKLRLELSGRDRERMLKRTTQNIEAYHLYLKGRFLWIKRTGEGLIRALEYFHQAIEKDPNYVLPLAGLADAYLVLSVFDASPARGHSGKGKQIAQRAMEIDPEVPETLTAYGLLQACLDWDWAAGERSLRRAIELKPDYWLAHDHYGMLLSGMGRHEEAMREVRRGLELEPLSPVVGHHFAWVHIHARRYQEAIDECRKAIEIDPMFPLGHYWLGSACTFVSRFDEAIRELQAADRLLRLPFIKLELARAYAVAGQTVEARGILAEMHQTFDRDYAEPYAMAAVYAALGEADQAFHWLDRACQDRTSLFSLWVNSDPRFDSVSSDARMKVLLDKVAARLTASSTPRSS